MSVKTKAVMVLTHFYDNSVGLVLGQGRRAYSY